MYSLKVKVQLSYVNMETYNLIGEINRLSSCNKQFILRFSCGKKVFLQTCNGLIKTAYIAVRNKKMVSKQISLINYAISLQTPLDISLEYKEGLLIFEITENLNKLVSFAMQLGVDYSFLIPIS